MATVSAYKLVSGTRVTPRYAPRVVNAPDVTIA